MGEPERGLWQLLWPQPLPMLLLVLAAAAAGPCCCFFVLLYLPLLGGWVASWRYFDDNA